MSEPERSHLEEARGIATWADSPGDWGNDTNTLLTGILHALLAIHAEIRGDK